MAGNLTGAMYEVQLANALTARAAVHRAFRFGGAVRLCPKKRTTDKSLTFNRNREGSNLLLAFAAIDFLGTSRLLPSFSGC
jgi:hypothetical protein